MSITTNMAHEEIHEMSRGMALGLNSRSSSKLEKLAKIIDWELLNESFKDDFKGREKPDRLIIGLLYLKAMTAFNSNDVIKRFRFNPVWQNFCGIDGRRKTPEISPLMLDIWEREVGASGSKMMSFALLKVADKVNNNNVIPLELKIVKEETASETNFDKEYLEVLAMSESDMDIYLKEGGNDADDLVNRVKRIYSKQNNK